jgi:hypothetical protein
MGQTLPLASTILKQGADGFSALELGASVGVGGETAAFLAWNASMKAPSYDQLSSSELPASVFSWSRNRHSPQVSLSV